MGAKRRGASDGEESKVFLSAFLLGLSDRKIGTDDEFPYIRLEQHDRDLLVRASEALKPDPLREELDDHNAEALVSDSSEPVGGSNV